MSIRKNVCILILLLLSFFFLPQVSSAINMQVTKTAADSINMGETLKVRIDINNLENSEISVTVKEHVTNADPVQPASFYKGEKCPYQMCAEPPFYLWNVVLSPISVYTINYEIKPLGFGSFSLPPTEVNTSSGEIFYSSSLVVNVLCKPNGACEPNLGENYLTCSSDCPSGSADGVCDLIKDGRCDPDCTTGADSDCLQTTTIPTTTTLPTEKPKTPIFIYIIIIAIVIAVAVFFLLKIKTVRTDNI